jgi:outer membrane protein TolC
MRLSIVVGVSVLFLAAQGGAQDITEESFLSGLSADSAALRALGDGLARAEGARKRAGVVANPRVDFWQERPDTNPRVTNWTLAWTPPLDGRYRLGKQAADAGLKAAREQLSADKALLRHEIRAAFAAWSLSFERRAALRRQRERIHGLAEMERQRARVGEESGLSARRFTLAEAEVAAALAAAEAAYERAAALSRAWRPDLPPEVRPAPVVLPNPPESVDSATSPELRAGCGRTASGSTSSR